MKKIILILIVVLVVAFLAVFLGRGSYTGTDDLAVACTMEVKICSDGTAVGRSGPKCEFAKCPEVSGTVEAKKELTLSVGEKGELGEFGLTLKEIVQDSRCPADVTCVWAGLVEAKVLIAGNSKSETVNISSGSSPYRFDGYDFFIISVLPVSNSKKQITPSEYQVTFLAEKV